MDADVAVGAEEQVFWVCDHLLINTAKGRAQLVLT